MKKIIAVGLILTLLKVSNSYSQDVINPYLLRENPNPDPFSTTHKYSSVNIEILPSNFLWESTPDENVSSPGGYNGEYMISLKFNSWHGNYKAQSGGLIYYNSGLTEFGQYTKTYSTEVVSFPFTINCYDGLNGCADGITSPPVRNMYMPDLSHPYNASGKYWESSLASNGTNNPAPLRNVHENLCFNAVEGMSAQSCPNNYAGKLVSVQFVSIDQLGSLPYTPGQTGVSVLPHTAIKHTVYLHCPSTNDVVAKFSWIYDNTRGMMRCYPFTDSNAGLQTGAAKWDVMFAPMLLMENATSTPPVNFYNRTNNFNPLSGEGIFPGGTINYYPFSEIDNNGCTTFPLPNSSDVFNQSALSGPTGQPTSYPYYLYEPIGAGNSYPFFAPYLLLSAPLRNAYGRDLAGYENLNANEMKPILQPSQRIWQQYHIDQNIDLSIINPSEKTIYNPSEVTITADNLIFPNDYTFKTIRGVYPTADEVISQNTIQNCGYYTDLRQVPVRTDLRFDPNATSSGATYPHDPANPQNSVYASIYTMESGSKITIGNCTRIFDATFKVNTGSTLIFNDYSQTCGYEDMSYTLGRYKLIGNGGAILRNYDLTQYVQNGVITQDLSATPYIAQNTIIAGDDDYLPPYDTDENPDLVQADGPYEIQTGGEVEFIAGDFIHLRDGFSVSGGKFHAKTVGTVAMPDMCYYQQLQGGGNRTAGNQTYNQNISIFNVTPNPGNGMFNLTVNAMDDKAMLYVEDMFGKNILQQKVNNYKTALDLNNLPKGVYFVKYFCYNTMQSKKVIIQ